MAAINVRSLPDDIHNSLRTSAAAKGTSVEALVRGLLADATKPAGGMAEAQQRRLAPGAVLDSPASKASRTQDLWGALRGTVWMAPGTDLAAPAGEKWDAEG